jgi:3-phenylpropionate/trans-cinnamate dioxygenase ferredoxin reductase subunit
MELIHHDHGDDRGGAGMVVIGAGHCGGRAALALRTQGWTGAITLIGEETVMPYERPALSKAVLAGSVLPEALHLADAAAYAQAGITLMLGAKVADIDRAPRCVTLYDGAIVPYRRLLLATGGAARTLQIPGAADARVLALRTQADALRIRAQLRPGARVILIGGGFIGLEVAASARGLGCAVDVIEGAPRLLGRAVPSAIAARVQALHAANGTRIHCGVRPEAIRPGADGALELLLIDGTVLPADLIVAGIGMVPRTELALRAGLAVEQGIVVDAHLRTSDPAIFAAGDVCQFPSPSCGAPIRQETWHNAETQAAVAAANMLGADQPYRQTPWFWSDQYDHTLQVCGEPDRATTSVERDGGATLMQFFLDDDGALVGASGFGPAGAAKELKLMCKLVEQGARPAPALLRDPAHPLKALRA